MEQATRISRPVEHNSRIVDAPHRTSTDVSLCDEHIIMLAALVASDHPASLCAGVVTEACGLSGAGCSLAEIFEITKLREQNLPLCVSFYMTGNLSLIWSVSYALLERLALVVEPLAQSSC